jgi:ribosomal protein L3 glutamine methyltransferase
MVRAVRKRDVVSGARPRIAPVTRPAPSPEAFRPRLRTARDALRYAVTRFEHADLCHGHGVAGSFDEAAWMVLWALHLPPDRLEPYLDAAVSQPEIETVIELVSRRCVERVPLAYLTGEAWLRGRRFICDDRALVPRSLIAEVIDEGLDAWLVDEPAHVLDLCTGGGSLAILAAYRWPHARIVGSDLSADALELAAENVALHRLGERIRLAQGDLFAGIGRRRFDLVLCNPPYVNQRSVDALPAEFRHEPAAALAGGPDGMDIVRRILVDAPRHLTARGHLLLEIGHEQAHFEAAFPELEITYLPVAAGEHALVWLPRDRLPGRK